MTHIKALIFDKDGTLFDFATTWEGWAISFLARLSQETAQESAALGAAIGFDIANRKFAPSSVAIAGMPSEIAETLVPHCPGMTATDLLNLINDEAEKAPQYPAVPLAPLLVDFRNRGLKLGVATNDGYAPAIAHLAQAEVQDSFDFVAGYDSGYGGKPAPGQLLAFAGEVNLAPEHIAMVGDSTHDLQAGRAAGMACVGVLTGMASANRLAPLADVVLPDIGHLPAWLDTLATGAPPAA